MGRVTDFDHFAWAPTSTPRAGTATHRLPVDRLENPPERKQRFLRQGDPDNQAFHHDLYRAVGGHGPGGGGPSAGRWWVMEQQPGPVNWAPYNPAPLPGMVRLWTWEAFAHGAEVVSYFRWRQFPQAQEQMHAGLLRPDSAPAPASTRRARSRASCRLGRHRPGARPPWRLVFDYESAWAWEVAAAGAGLRLLPPGLRRLPRLPPRRAVGRHPAARHGGPVGLQGRARPGLMRLPGPVPSGARLPSTASRSWAPAPIPRTEELFESLPLGPPLPGCDVSVVLAGDSARRRVLAGGRGRFLSTGVRASRGRCLPVRLRTPEGRPALVGEPSPATSPAGPDDARPSTGSSATSAPRRAWRRRPPRRVAGAGHGPPSLRVSTNAPSRRNGAGSRSPPPARIGSRCRVRARTHRAALS
jgi:beta-galactosidase